MIYQISLYYHKGDKKNFSVKETQQQVEDNTGNVAYLAKFWTFRKLMFIQESLIAPSSQWVQITSNLLHSF